MMTSDLHRHTHKPPGVSALIQGSGPFCVLVLAYVLINWFCPPQEFPHQSSTEPSGFQATGFLGYPSASWAYLDLFLVVPRHDHLGLRRGTHKAAPWSFLPSRQTANYTMGDFPATGLYHFKEGSGNLPELSAIYISCEFQEEPVQPRGTTVG